MVRIRKVHGNLWINRLNPTAESMVQKKMADFNFCSNMIQPSFGLLRPKAMKTNRKQNSVKTDLENNFRIAV